MKKSIILLSVAASFALADVYTLGQVKVQTKSADDINMIEKNITSSDIAQNNERTIAESLDNMSGVSLTYMGPRGESKVSIRGQDASRIGVFVDGVPVYVPYDGNFDFGRFLTNDVSEIDVSKGYSSIAYGSNTMGGVINIVTKKPTKELEGNIRGELVLDSNGQMARHLESINIGSKVGNFYGQLSGVYSKRDHFRLSDDYTPDAGSAQPEGDRVRSEARDQKISFKTGYVADDASELALSYANQKGQKQHPINAYSGNTRFMDSPYWNKETISLSGLKNFGNSYIKAVAYYDKSQNSMNFYLDKTYTTLQFNPSRYDDFSYGARLEYGLESGNNFLKLATNYKKDTHRGYETKQTTNTESLSERFEGHTISLGAEDTYKITRDLEILAGVSCDKLKADKAFYPKGYQGLDTISAVNPQAALIYTLDPESKIKASASRKAYLPSMKDRYSGGMGTMESNPDLDKETTDHYELGYTHQNKNFLISTNLYLSQVKNAIQGAATNLPYTKANGTVDYKPDGVTPKGYKTQNQNVGDFDHKGLEIDAAYTLDNTKVGANYSYIDVENKNNSAVKRIGVPKHQVFAFGEQKLNSEFSLYANMKYRNGAHDQMPDKTYAELASFTTFDIKAMYSPVKNLMFEAGIKNITDKLMQYSAYYPEAGREYFATMNYKF